MQAQAIAAQPPAPMPTPVVEQQVAAALRRAHKHNILDNKGPSIERTHNVMETDVQLAPGYIETFAEWKGQNTWGDGKRAR